MTKNNTMTAVATVIARRKNRDLGPTSSSVMMRILGQLHHGRARPDAAAIDRAVAATAGPNSGPGSVLRR